MPQSGEVLAKGAYALSTIFEPRGAGGVGQARLALSLEDRDLQNSQDVVFNSLNSAYGRANTFAEFLSTGERDPERFHSALNELSLQGLNLTGEDVPSSPFYAQTSEELKNAHPRVLLQAYGTFSANQIRKDANIQAVLQKGGRHRLVAEKALRRFEQNISNLLTVDTVETAGFSGKGVPQREVEVTQQLLRLVPSTQAGQAGELVNVEERKAKGVFRKVVLPDGTVQQIQVGNASSANQALMNIAINHTFKQAALFSATSNEPGANRHYENLRNLDSDIATIDQEVEATIKAKQAAGETTAERLNAIREAQEELARDKDVGGETQRIARTIDLVSQDISNFPVVMKDLYDRTIQTYTKQVEAKAEMMDELTADVTKLIGFFFEQGGAKTGKVPLPSVADRDKLPKFLADMDPETFADGQLSKSEIMAYIQRFGNVVARGGTREGIEFAARARSTFGKDVATKESLEPFLQYNSGVNKQFTDFIDNNVKFLAQAKGTGDELDRINFSKDVMTDEVGRMNAEAKLNFEREQPWMAEKRLKDEYIINHSRAALARFFSSFTDTLMQGRGFESLMDPVASGQYVTGMEDGLEEMSKGAKGNTLKIQRFQETLFNNLIGDYAKRIIKLDTQGDAPAKEELRKMKVELGPNLLRSYIYVTDAYLKFKPFLTTMNDQLNPEKLGRPLNSAERAQKQRIETVIDLYDPDKDKMGGLLIKLGYTKSQIEQSFSRKRAFENAVTK